MSNTPALTVEYSKVIAAKFVTKRDGSPMLCMTCGTPLVMGSAYAATNGNGWTSYCTTCATNPAGQIAGLVNRVETLVTPLGEDVPEIVVTMVAAATPYIEGVLAGCDLNTVEGRSAFTTAKSLLLAIRQQIGEAKKAVAATAVRTNSYGGKCATCGVYVAPQTGRIERLNGRWTTFHLVDQCPTSAPETATEPVENGLYFTPADGAIRKVYTTQNGHPGCKVLTTVAGKGTFLYVKGGVAVVRSDVAAGTARKLTQDEAAAFGRQHGFCCNCALDLTDDRSLAAGYGPVCAGNNGWSYPTYEQAATILNRPVTLPSGKVVTPTTV